MKSLFYLTVLVAVLGLLALGCEKATNPVEAPSPKHSEAHGLTKAGTFTSNVTSDIELSWFVPCAAGGAGEMVHLSGPLHVVIHTTINDNNVQGKIHRQPQGISGLGLSTGDKYQGTGVTQEQFSGSLVNGQFTRTFVNNFRIIGQGNGNNFLMHDTVHLTINANGEVTATVGISSFECK